MKIRERGLAMKLARVEQLFDGSRLIFYYTAEGRVDFRELVRDLAAHFRTRIEMRQIGVRDEARMLGGYGSCGRPLCCTTWLQTFEPISIKMAKQQNLSLNPSKLSGMCGRLKCCLRYELPNGKGVKHGGCADEGGCGSCSNPTGPGRRRLRNVRVGRVRNVRVTMRPRVGITVGDPAGIGPEIARKAAADPGGLGVLRRRALRAVDDAALGAFARGRVSAAAGRAAYDAIVRAVGRRAGGTRSTPIATAPINKEAFAAAGLPWRGHTDLLAHLTGAPRVAMMFYADALRVVLATVHIPLAEVPARADARGARGDDRAHRARAAALRHRRRRGSRSPGSTRTPASTASSAAKRTRCSRRRSRPAARGASRSTGRFRPTRCSCARCAASSTRSSPAITIRG